LASSKRKYRLGYSLAEYRRKVEAGEWQFHQFEHGFLITEVRDYAEERVLVVHLAGGSRFDEWKDAANVKLTRFGKKHRCVAIEAICRLGFEKKLQPLGMRRHRVVMRKDL
jgi:hypothetical protein